jgi:hypothetical protein
VSFFRIFSILFYRHIYSPIIVAFYRFDAWTLMLLHWSVRCCLWWYGFKPTSRWSTKRHLLNHLILFNWDYIDFFKRSRRQKQRLKFFCLVLVWSICYHWRNKVLFGEIISIVRVTPAFSNPAIMFLGVTVRGRAFFTIPGTWRMAWMFLQPGSYSSVSIIFQWAINW